MSTVEGNDLVLVNYLFDGLIEVGSLTVKETYGEVLRPLSCTENEQDAENNGQVVILLDDFFPWVIR